MAINWKNQKMKILFILGAYKPRASANGLCSLNIIRCLKDEGHSVTVLCNQTIGCGRHTIEDNIPIYRVKQRLYLRLKEYSEVYANAEPTLSRIVACFAHIINKLQLMLFAPFWPIISPKVNKRFARMAKELQKRNNYNVVISVYTPIEALLAGYELKKEHPQVKFIPYFLDSLSGGYGPKLFSEKKTLKRGLKIEAKVYDIADAIILMKSSEGHQKEHNGQYVKKMKFLDIPMFVKPKNDKLSSTIKYNSEQYKLLFVGSISRNIRNPETLINALCHLDREDIVCEFVGNIDCMEDFVPLKAKMGEKLIFSAFMDHDKLAEKISAAHILINIGNRLPTMVPSKIFEYMSYSKPIISTYDIENEPSVEYLRVYPAALLLSGLASPVENASLISQFIQNIDNVKVDYDALEKQFYLNTPKAFREIIDGL